MHSPHDAQLTEIWECPKLNDCIMRAYERQHIWQASLFMVPHAILTVVSPIIHTIKPQAQDVCLITPCPETSAREISNASMLSSSCQTNYAIWFIKY